MVNITRRGFLGGTAAGVALLVLDRGDVDAPTATAPTATVPVVAPVVAEDPRVAALIALSRDRHGVAHIARAAFVRADHASGTLPIAADELADLQAVLASRDVTPFQERGLRVDGHKFVFIRESEDGAVVHAVRRGEFVTVRKTADELIIATSGDGMAHPRAVEAVYQYARRSARVA